MKYVQALIRLDGTREEFTPPPLGLRWSKDGKLQQAIRVNVERPGGSLGYYIEETVEWIDIPTEGDS